MPVSPAAFLAFLEHNAASLSVDERAALLAFAADIDPALSPDALTARLSRFLLEHETLDRRLEGQQLRGIAGQPMKLTTPAALQTNIRNLVLQAQPTQPKDGGTPPKP